MRTFLTSLLFLTVLLSASGFAQDVKKQIRILRVGSSSFPYSLFEITRDIAEASGKYELISEKGDSTGYTRLDQFVSRPGLFEEWCEEQGPRIKDGNYDYVIVQTLGWPGMKPEGHDLLCGEILPELSKMVHEAGAEMILYDKYLKPELDQKDPRARTWVQRYPEGYKLSYLLHIMAAKHGDIKGVGFGGQAITEMWHTPEFKKTAYLFADTSHPGPIANYISALNLAYLITGEDFIGNPVRELPLEDGRYRGFMGLPESHKPWAMEVYEANKDRVREGVLTLSDEEAQMLQEAAWKSQKEWGTLLNECKQDDEKFAEVMQEIRRIQGEREKYKEYGMDESRIAAKKKAYAPPAEPGGIRPAAMAKIRRKSRSIDYAEIDVRKALPKYLPREKHQNVRQAYADYWHENNSKLRDDIYFELKVAIAEALKAGERDEAQRLEQVAGAIHLVLSFPAYMVFFEEITKEQKQEMLEKYQITGAKKRATPNVTAYLNENRLDEKKLVRAWKAYMDIWSDPDLNG
ncbi:MAG: hypothetical protein ACOCVL_02035 [Candidatus Sumerlaeota bacterium]